MPMSMIDELFQYWREFPPAHWLLRAQLRYEPPAKKEEVAPSGKPVFFNALPKSIARAANPDREIFELLKAS